MDDKKTQKPHEDLGEVGDLGAIGELGSNAAGAKRNSGVIATQDSGFRLVQANLSEAEGSAETQLAIALARVGFDEDESRKMAKSAVEEIARRSE